MLVEKTDTAQSELDSWFGVSEKEDAAEYAAHPEIDGWQFEHNELVQWDSSLLCKQINLVPLAVQAILLVVAAPVIQKRSEGGWDPEEVAAKFARLE